MKTRSTTLLFLLALSTSLACVEANAFELVDMPGKHLDVMLDGKLAARYMYAHDPSSEESRHETYKPYLHVYNAAGTEPLTKGSGGQYTHHRGIFIGWNKIGYKGKTYDRWHMKNGDMVHQKFLDQSSDTESATFTSLTHWQDDEGKPMIVEERTLTFRRPATAARLLIDFTSKLSAPNGDILLDGDPEHAGVHFRPSDAVDRKKTRYTFPEEDADPKKDEDYAWVGATYSLNDQTYSVVHMNHPDNPKGTKYSAYRDYGRFGAFFVGEIPSGESLTVKYRFLIVDGELPPREAIQESAKAFD